MSSPFANYPVPERSFMPSSTPSTSAAARGALPTRGTGAKRGRKPKNANANGNGNAGPETPRTPSASQPPTQSSLQWTDSHLSGASSSQPAPGTTSVGASSTPAVTQDAQAALLAQGLSLPGAQPSAATPGAGGESGTPGPSGAAAGATTTGAPAGEEDGDGEDEVLPAMADDDYSAQLSWQSQSKDNLKVLMDNFSPQQYDRFESYRRHALPKQAVRKVIQQATGQQVSQSVAQVVAGFSKVFVGEIVEKGP
uniref:Extracellular metalloproteinase 1 ) n=1 Tax=Ganoderma boninense TaxID=34458 RepID=A0A5K1K0S4_9APHY|nr:Extracellular metalloproteinase 1 (EC (Fungalysin MEP1) [Ganoderma boninense]